MRFAALGNLTADIIRTSEGTRRAMGGSACYCGLTARKLNCETHILTRVGRGYNTEWLRQLRTAGVKLCIERSRSTLVFENVYTQAGRTQLIRGNAGAIREIPEEIRDCDLIHAGPVFSEVSLGLLKGLGTKFISLDVQGFIRRRNGNRVHHKFWSRRDKFLECTKILHVGADEARFVVKERCKELLEMGPEVVAVTDSRRGSYLLFEDSSKYIPAFPTRTIDQTGAGDVYTAALAIRYLETRDPVESGYFASAAASFVVEDWGPRRLGTMEEVEERKKLLQEGIHVEDNFALPSPITLL
jgi:sugar/nucleoside kinase (ribokinase family)